LNEQGAFFRIETGTEPIDHHFIDITGNGAGVFVVAGQGVPVGNKEKTVVFVLHADPVGQGAVQIAQMKRAGGPHTA
jgi:hypothetical protein